MELRATARRGLRGELAPRAEGLQRAADDGSVDDGLRDDAFGTATHLRDDGLRASATKLGAPDAQELMLSPDGGPGAARDASGDSSSGSDLKSGSSGARDADSDSRSGSGSTGAEELHFVGDGGRGRERRRGGRRPARRPPRRCARPPARRASRQALGGRSWRGARRRRRL